MKLTYLSVVATALVAATAALAQAPGAPSKKIEISATSTEAMSIIGTQYFIAGTLAKNCAATLGKPETYTKETQNQWIKRNQKFIDALTLYQGALFEGIEAKFGEEKLESEKVRVRQITINQGTAIVDQFMARGEKSTLCAKVDQGLNDGYFDITPKFPLYPEAMALVQATAP